MLLSDGNVDSALQPDTDLADSPCDGRVDEPPIAEGRDVWSIWRQAEDARKRARKAAEGVAETAESMAATFERVADTYRWMAESVGSADKVARLLLHSARLNDLARRERAEAVRLRQILNADG